MYFTDPSASRQLTHLKARGKPAPPRPRRPLAFSSVASASWSRLDQRDEGCEIFFDPRKGRGENGRIQRRDDLVAVGSVAFTGREEGFQARLRKARIILAFVLESSAFMAAAEAADVPDLRLGEMRGGIAVELVLRAGAEAGRAVAEKNLLALVFLLQEVVERHRPKSEGIAEKVFLSEGMGRLRSLSRALGLGGLDHAFKEIRL